MPIAGRNTVPGHALGNHVIIVISHVLVSGVLPVPPSLISAHGLARVRKLVLTIFTRKTKGVRTRLTKQRASELQIYNVAKKFDGSCEK